MIIFVFYKKKEAVNREHGRRKIVMENIKRLLKGVS